MKSAERQNITLVACCILSGLQILIKQWKIIEQWAHSWGSFLKEENWNHCQAPRPLRVNCNWSALARSIYVPHIKQIISQQIPQYKSISFVEWYKILAHLNKNTYNNLLSAFTCVCGHRQGTRNPTCCHPDITPPQKIRGHNGWL